MKLFATSQLFSQKISIADIWLGSKYVPAVPNLDFDKG